MGPLTGNRLAPLPSVTMPWGEWRKIHPDTLILSRKQAEVRRPPDYTSDPFAGDRYSNRLDDFNFPFLVDEAAIDTRLRPSEIAITVRVDELEKAYPIGRLGDAVVNDEISGEPVVVFSRQDGAYGQGFSRMLDDRILSFRLDDGEITDQETGSRWDISGNAISGELEGRSLDLLTARRALWFSLAFAVPDVPLYDPS